MSLAIAATAIQRFRQMVAQAFPERNDVEQLHFDGSFAQAWPAFARLLAIETAELARVIAPLYGVRTKF
ncbi:MAG: hypothetical protein O2975_09425 [Proteobacteria bacterium]|nr:hypothetical protein [Pseudomonadota bacterium]